MNIADYGLYGIVGLVITGLAAWGISYQLSPEARERRRCRRNHRRVVSRARRPMVMLSAKAPRG
jgi:hypothetical protein